jgi:hypothetical protein
VIDFLAAPDGFGPVHIQPWISQPPALFFSANVICAASPFATPPSLKVYTAGTTTAAWSPLTSLRVGAPGLTI